MRKSVLCGGVLWLTLCAAGFAMLWRYQNVPGQSAQAPTHWPAASELSHDDDRLTLLLFIHPQCPCTRAAVRELERFLPRHGQRFRLQVLVYAPVDMPDEWIESDLWDQARALPGAKVLRDVDGEEARRFGAATSGQVFVYHADGGLAFCGGLTSVRGHEGRSSGLSALESLARGTVDSVSSTPVFGCPIFDSENEVDR